MRYNDATHKLECEIKLTAHDLEKSIRIISRKPFVLDKASLEESNNKLLSEYLRNKFKVQIQGKALDPIYIGYEVDANDEVWVYIEFSTTKKLENINISNQLLTETFSEQKNITNFKTAQSTQSIVFEKADSFKTFKVNE